MQTNRILYIFENGTFGKEGRITPDEMLELENKYGAFKGTIQNGIVIRVPVLTRKEKNNE